MLVQWGLVNLNIKLTFCRKKIIQTQRFSSESMIDLVFTFWMEILLGVICESYSAWTASLSPARLVCFYRCGHLKALWWALFVSPKIQQGYMIIRLSKNNNWFLRDWKFIKLYSSISLNSHIGISFHSMSQQKIGTLELILITLASDLSFPFIVRYIFSTTT